MFFYFIPFCIQILICTIIFLYLTFYFFNKNAALYVKDADAKELLLDKAIEAVNQPELLKNLSKNIAELAFTDSANVIAKEVIKLAQKYKEEHGC